jgi:DNA-directed RNA polymerase specialized sigma24 family protein
MINTKDWLLVIEHYDSLMLNALQVPGELLMNNPEEVQKIPTEELYERHKRFAKAVDEYAAQYAALLAYQGGQPIKEIAQQAGKSEGTIRRWLKEMKGL